MFSKQGFIDDCRNALKESNAQAAVHELVQHALSNPAQVVKALGEPTRAGVETLYKADDLTILNLCWGPRMSVKPHDHQLWAVIGIYGGSEENTFYRRNEGGGLTRHGTRELQTRDSAPLGEKVIHSVTNPLNQLTGAIHVYGGDFFTKPRSEWTEQFEERPYDVAQTMQAFEESNALLDRLAAES